VQVRGWWRGKGEVREGMRDAEGGRGRTYHWASLPTTSDEVIELGCEAFLQRPAVASEKWSTRILQRRHLRARAPLYMTRHAGNIDLVFVALRFRLISH